MWPKMLLELVPHIARLVPVADKFFQSKAGGEEANRRAMEAMSEGLRGDLGQVTTAHAGIYRQLNEQAGKLDEISTQTRASRAAAESVEARITNLERRLDRIATLLLVVTLLVVATLGIGIALFVTRPH
jgi:hypothetical protein